MGYEIIGTALFGVLFIYLSSKTYRKADGGSGFIFSDGWRDFLFNWGWLHGILMYGLAAAPDAIALKSLAIFIYAAILTLIITVRLFTAAADMWNNTR